MIDNEKEYIICSGIWFDDGIPVDGDDVQNNDPLVVRHFRGATFQNKNIKTGFVIGQWRHGNIIAIRPSNPKFNHGLNTIQGFISSKGKFYDRWQAMWIAYNAGQVDTEHAFINGASDKFPDFDFDKFLDEEPSNDHRYTSPMRMMYSEDIY